MPHKVNPIDFENAEGNLGVANAILDHLSQKLPISRWQRDLSDSTVLRNLGVGIAQSYLAYQNLLRGMSKIRLDEARLRAELNVTLELLAEPIQTILRQYRVENAYEKLKELTRGQTLDAAGLEAFCQSLDIPEEAREKIAQLDINTYLGAAEQLAKSI